MLFNSVLDGVEDLIDNPNDHKVTSLALDEGYISTDKNDYDRIIVMYSYDSGYNFTAQGLDNTDNVFQVIMSDGDVTKAVVFWRDEHGKDYYNETITKGAGSSFESSDDDYTFTGTINMTLYDGDELFGSIWLFDSNYLTYTLSSNMGTRGLTLEKGGVVYSDSKNTLVKRPFSFYADDGTLTLGVIQTITSDSFSTGLNRVGVRIDTISHGSYVRETKHVHYFKLQFYGGYTQAWLTYLSRNYDFTEVLDNTLFYKKSDLFVSFSHSIIEFDIN